MKIKNILLSVFVLFNIISYAQIEKIANDKSESEINSSPKVVSFDNKVEFEEFSKMNLDSIYTNLLDPQNVTESEYKTVLESWSQFHKKVSKFIKEENFKWEVPDSTITIQNRIYFDKSGTIDYYSFKIVNPSISAEKRAEFEKVIQKFSKTIIIDLPRDTKYAQCGKTKYLNY